MRAGLGEAVPFDGPERRVKQYNTGMRILCVDIGTGTQDVLLFDSDLDVENGLKLVVPSPTMIVRRRIQAATRARRPLLLTGVTMGGGPSHWAVEDHLRAGLPVFATPAAARSFNDDLDAVAEMGVTVVSPDEAGALSGEILRLELKDFDFLALRRAFEPFGVSLDDLSLVAVAVFDHGAAPPGYSDRKFRFEYIERQVRLHNRLSAFAFHAGEIPEILTRMQAVADSARDVDAPLMLMDTAPAAVLGSLLDPQVRAWPRKVVANVGNFHTLAFRLGPAGIEGVFEHHTGLLTRAKLDELLRSLADGSLTDEAVFRDQGHGARIFSEEQRPFPAEDFGAAVVGPRRSMLAASPLRPHFAAPFGDMMLVGCFGMLAAAAAMYPELEDPLQASLLREASSGTAPWESGG